MLKLPFCLVAFLLLVFKTCLETLSGERYLPTFYQLERYLSSSCQGDARLLVVYFSYSYHFSRSLARSLFLALYPPSFHEKMADQCADDCCKDSTPENQGIRETLACNEPVWLIAHAFQTVSVLLLKNPNKIQSTVSPIGCLVMNSRTATFAPILQALSYTTPFSY